MIRKTIFWAHLTAGLIAGLSIGVMCLTGTALAFDKQLVAWWERDARRVEVPADNPAPLPLAELQARLKAAQPDFPPVTAVILNDPGAAIAVTGTGGAAGTMYVDPYTGTARTPRSTAMNTFMRSMTSWHRYLNFAGDGSRPRGRLVNGVCNIAFCVLAVSGLYLWIPRSWSWRSIRGVSMINASLRGKARDFNWHNAIGFWSAPILIVLTITAFPISFRWGANALYTVTGTPMPEGGAASGRGAAAPAIAVPTPPDGARPMTTDALVAAAQRELPSWQQITVRLAGTRAGMAPSFAIRDAKAWPRTATTTLSLNPYTGEVLRREGYATMNAAQQLRSWTRFLHTGEALGRGGQLVAGLACLGGCFLVYTGFALALRRFFGRRKPA